MKYDLNNEVDRIKFTHRVKDLLIKSEFVELKNILPIRSNQINKYLHVLLSYFAVEYGETKEYVKQTMFKKLNSDIFLFDYANKKTGEIREAYRSTSDLDNKELSLAIERFRDYASKEAGIYLPDANENEFLKSCEIEIEKHKQYL